MQEMCVYMTMPTVDVAREIGQVLIKEHLAACVNILSGVESMYHWEGAVQHEPEIVMIAKTRATMMDALTQRVKDLHPYEVPCIVAWPIAQGYAPFLDWINAQTSRPVGHN